MLDARLPKTLLQLLKPRLPQMLATLRRFVTAESPSLEKAAADRCCRVIAEEWNKRGTRVERIAQKHRGDLLRITPAPNKSGSSGQLLVLGHYDTVYSTGTLAKMPFRLEGGKAYGPGTFDMNAGIVQGGTRTNVIPERARALLDLRALRNSDMRSLERRLHALRPLQSGARLEVTGGFDRPPLERKMSASLYACAKSLAKEMNVSLGECTVGGGSDGNFTAALGIPTLDGLGAVGDSAHSSHEHILINTMPSRAALLAALLATI